jgi:asparaginyl-tRNA synthetase
VIAAAQEWLNDQGFVRFDTPILTPVAAEGTSNLFSTEYFDLGPAYLAQTGQLYVEAGMMSFGKVYCFGPTFRAEKSKTRRHLTEFWMMEPEVAYAELDDVCDLAEDLLCRIVQEVLERRRAELAVLERDLTKLECVRKPFPRITYREASEFLRAHPESQFVDGDDFGAPDETLLSNRYDRPVLVTRYPAAVKSFYMKRDPQDPSLALCVDVLGSEGVGELIGGSQREDDLAVLEQRIREHELPEEYFQWYLDLRRFGTVPHGGFGLGLERTVAWICGIEHIREAIPFPRTMYRLEP